MTLQALERPQDSAHITRSWARTSHPDPVRPRVLVLLAPVGLGPFASMQEKASASASTKWPVWGALAAQAFSRIGPKIGSVTPAGRVAKNPSGNPGKPRPLPQRRRQAPRRALFRGRGAESTPSGPPDARPTEFPDWPPRRSALNTPRQRAEHCPVHQPPREPTRSSVTPFAQNERLPARRGEPPIRQRAGGVSLEAGAHPSAPASPQAHLPGVGFGGPQRSAPAPQPCRGARSSTRRAAGLTRARAPVDRRRPCPPRTSGRSREQRAGGGVPLPGTGPC